MPLTKGTTAGVLPAQTNASAVKNQRAKSDGFSKRPIHRQCALAHFRAACELPYHLGVYIEILGHHCDLLSDTLDYFGIDSSLNYLRPLKLCNRGARLGRLLLRHDLFRPRERVFVAPHALADHLF